MAPMSEQFYLKDLVWEREALGWLLKRQCLKYLRWVCDLLSFGYNFYKLMLDSNF